MGQQQDKVWMRSRSGEVREVSRANVDYYRKEKGAVVVGPPQTLGTMTERATRSINPVEFARGMRDVALHPVATASGLASLPGELATQAYQDFRQGNYLRGARKAFTAALPIAGGVVGAVAGAPGGPPGMVAGGLTGYAGGSGLAAGLNEGIDEYEQRNWATGTGALIDASVQGLLGGRAARSRASVPPPPTTREAQLAQWGLREGIPVDPPSTSANRLGRVAQQLSEHSSIPGSLIATKAKQARQQGLATVGERLASKVSQSAETPETAGAAVRAGVEGKIREFKAAADQHYGVLDKIVQDVERSGVETWRLQVDLRGARAALAPRLYELQRKKELSGLLMGREGQIAFVLDKLVNGPDFAHIISVDAALGDLKAMARGAEMSELRSGAQGAAAEAVRALSRAVDSTTAVLGPRAVQALKAGRQATREKWAAAEVLDALNAEPVKTFRGATAPQDAAVMHLREIAKLSPDSLPRVGRAVLDSMFTLATEKGGFDHVQKIASDWRRLGPETKKLLYQPDHVADLDRFFALAEKMSENLNPSGSGLAVATLGAGAAFWMNPLGALYQQVGGAAMAKALNSPAVTRALVNTLQSSASTPSKVARMDTVRRLRQLVAPVSATARAVRVGEVVMVGGQPQIVLAVNHETNEFDARPMGGKR
ncbi:MAG: hypothetical protein FJ202_12710 [Gemmatimonadetes bacterium]|nr:hypothetical protein [Gemmatimonadota bacterium]